MSTYYYCTGSPQKFYLTNFSFCSDSRNQQNAPSISEIKAADAPKKPRFVCFYLDLGIFFYYFFLLTCLFCIFRAPEPPYHIMQEPSEGHPEFLVAEIHLPKIVSHNSSRVYAYYFSCTLLMYTIEKCVVVYARHRRGSNTSGNTIECLPLGHLPTILAGSR